MHSGLKLYEIDTFNSKTLAHSLACIQFNNDADNYAHDDDAKDNDADNDADDDSETDNGDADNNANNEADDDDADNNADNNCWQWQF